MNDLSPRRAVLCASLSLLALLASACGRDYDKEPSVRAEEATKTADAHLANGRIRDAHQEYENALGLDPSSTRAAFGSGFTKLLLLPEAPAVNALLDACGQPHLDVEGKVFGGLGLLAQDAKNRMGAGSLTLLRQDTPGQGFVDTGFRADSYRSAAGAYVSVRLRDLDLGGQSASVELSLNRDDVYSGDALTTPLRDGLAIDLSRALGLYAWAGGLSGSSSATGTVVFRGGLGEGQGFSLEFQNVTVNACGVVNGTYSCSSQFRLNGTVSDTFDGTPLVNPLGIPFLGVTAEAGPPSRDVEIVALELCPNLTTDLVGERAKSLAADLELIAARLETATGAAPESAAYTIPKGLLYAQTDIAVNGADLLATRSLLRAAASALHLVGSYRYLDGKITSLIGNYTYWYGSPATSQLKRGFLVQSVVNNLNATFLTRAAGFALTPVQSNLDAALRDGEAALRLAPQTPGVLQLAHPSLRPHVGELANLLAAIRQSLTSPTPVAMPNNPLYRLHLKKFFDAPLDRASILSNAGLASFFSFTAGDPNAADGYGRNDQFHSAVIDGAEGVETWLGGVVDVPGPEAGSCTSSATCPSGYSCSGNATSPGSCVAPSFSLVTATPSDVSLFSGQVKIFLEALQ